MSKHHEEHPDYDAVGIFAGYEEGLSPRFDDQTSPQSDPPLILWDKITQKNCMVEDCFSSRVFENTTYYRLEIAPSVFAWRRDDQVEEQAIFHGYDAEYLCIVYRAKFGKSYLGTAASIEATIENLLSKKADVSHTRTHDGRREIIGDLTDMIVQAMNWREI